MSASSGSASSLVPEKVEGTVQFVRHGGSRGLLCGENLLCPGSELYWAMVVTDGAREYTLEERFSVGTRNAPVSVTLDGVSVRPGMHIRLQGEVREVDQNHYLLSAAGHVSEVPAEDSQRDMNDQDHRRLVWSCRASSPMEVTVWQGENRSLDDYEVRVTVVKNSETRTVAEVEHVDTEVARDSLTFLGDSAKARLKLTLDQSSNIFESVPAELKLLKRAGGGPSIPEKSGALNFSTPLECDQVSEN